ncbi:MAG: hypothetical protein KF878_14190 [Planctomycetes bacterium]|nr:hypothetical protein [Planctomycetota bacterium]
MVPIEAVKSREGLAYLGGAALAFLISALLIAGGIERYLTEDALREAVQAYHRDAPDARAKLVELKDARPGDASTRVLLGCFELERAEDADRLGVAERLFEEALGLEPGRTSASVGLAAARLRLAALKAAEGRAREAASVGELIDRSGLDASDPDVVALRAGMEVLRGRPEQALQLLSSPPRTTPSRAGQGAWHWNRAAAAILARDGDALEAALPAYLLRRLPLPAESQNDPNGPPGDAARLLTMAYRVSLADPAARPPTTEALTQRLERAAAAATLRAGGSGLLRGRYLPPGREEAAVQNALGMAQARLERWADAAESFEQASRANPEEPLYMLNMALARRRQAEGIDAATDAKGRTAAFQRAGEAFRRLCESLAGKEGREATRVLAATSGASALLAGGDVRGAIVLYRTHSTGHPNPAEQARDLGALLDHAKDKACVDEYRRAISLNHPETAALERRVRVRSRR